MLTHDLGQIAAPIGVEQNIIIAHLAHHGLGIKRPQNQAL